MALFEPDSDLITGPEIPGAPAEPRLDVDDIQGVVLPGFGTTQQHLLGVSFADAAAARRWLGRWGDRVATLREVNGGRNRRRRALRLEQPRPRTPVWMGIALSAAALKELALRPEDLGDVAFTTGMAGRSGLLGDPPAGEDGHISTWVVGGSPETTPHALVILGGEDEQELDARVAELVADADGTVGYQQRGTMLEEGKEHFGFRDGVSQVGIRGRLSESPQHFFTRRWIDPADPLAMELARPGQPLVWPGQFVFGLDRQDPDGGWDPRPPRPAPDWARNGSLLAFRRLHQNVPAFREFCRAESDRLRGLPGFEMTDPDRFAAALVGRWPDGTALVRSAAPDPSAADDMLAINHFGFDADVPPVRVCADPLVAKEGLAAAGANDELREVAGAAGDPDALRCPRFAHVRKVNPRDRPTDQPDSTLTFQMLRRGITWGAPFVDGEGKHAADRGLLFMSWQTSLEDQFEGLTVRWMNRLQGPEGNSGHDMLVGQAPERECAFLGEGGRAEPVRTTERFVVPTGGGYFFGPSLTTLKALAKG